MKNVSRMPMLLAPALALALLSAACQRLNTPEKKAGYAVGVNFGRDLGPYKEKVDADQVLQGMRDQVAGKATLDDKQMQDLLVALSQGQAGDKVKSGYAVGVSMGRSIKAVAALVDMDALRSGLSDQLAGKPKLEAQALQQELQDFSKRAQAVMGEKNKAEGEAYLAKNKAKAGVTVTSTGLQVEVLREGKGPKPGAKATVKVDYVGTLIDGTKFDSSYDRKQPATFPLNGVIPGWTEGLQLMRTGSKYRFTIPAALAYGPRGQGPTIGPESVLVFEVELLAIVKK